MAYVVIQQHKFGRMYLCGWSKRWGATVCANRFVAIKFPTEHEARLARDHAATRMPDKKCRVRAAWAASGNLLTAVAW